MDRDIYWEGIDAIDFDSDSIPVLAKSLVSIFEPHSDIDKNAYLNWRMDFTHTRRRRFVIVGQAYFDTAYYMLQECLRDNLDKKADAWIFPILFHIVHGTEVYLKAINMSYSVALGKDKKDIQGAHDIKQLCSVARSLIIEFKTKHPSDTSDQLFEAIKVVGNFIENIYEKTSDMTFARYPTQSDKSDHFYIQCPENTVVNMEELNNQLPIIFHLLDFIFDMPEMFIDDMERVDYH